jgi:DNA polymerase III sliding clamp (beta) subunit (PCNA family)
MPALASDKDEFAGAKASICLNVGKLKYIITTTDGLKINRYSEKHNSETVKNGEYLVDQKAVKLISAFLKRTRYEHVKILALDSFIKISGQKEEIYLRLFNEKFPNTEEFFKSADLMPIVAELYAKPFMQILKRMELVIGRERKCKMDFDGTSLSLSNENDVNLAEEHIMLNTYKGDAISIALNIKHMLESLQAMNCHTFVKLRMDPSKYYAVMESDSESSKKCLLVGYK